MAETRGGSERKNYFIKTLIIVIALLLALLSTVLYVYTYPKTVVTLYSVCNNTQLKERAFQIKKYSAVGNVKPIEKFGYNFEYWSYDMGGITRLDAEREVDTDYLDLFGMYSLKEFTVRLWIQEYEEDVALDKPVLYKTYENIRFNSDLTLPTGLDENGMLIPQLSARQGYHFVGWTIKVDEEEVISKSDVTLAGENFHVYYDSDIDLYAYWEKNEYNVVTHTGNEYQVINGIPMRDSNGEFIIRNNRIQDSLKIKYLTNLSKLTAVNQATLSEEDSLVNVEGVNIMDHLEYEFVGWYLNEELTVPANADSMVVKIEIIDGREVPYLANQNDPTKNWSSQLNTETDEYEFHLYSKWKRKSYKLSFDKNSKSSSGKINDIIVYKYDDHYGKYYQTADFAWENVESEYFYQLDLSAPNDDLSGGLITSESFINSNKGYRFMGWSIESRPSVDNSQIYTKWYQDPITNENAQEKYRYINNTYQHLVSEDVTLYAQWATIKYVTFRERESSYISSNSFTREVVEDEWFRLPTKAEIEDLGWSKNAYTEFAGWKNSNGSKIYLEKEWDKYIWKCEANHEKNAYLYAYWVSKSYTVIFDLNYDGSTPITNTKEGGVSVYFPSAPTREGYIFDGWSKTDYEDNTLNKTGLYTSANKYTPSGEDTTIIYYASWTKNYSIVYDANGGEGKLPTTITYDKNGGKDLKLRITIGSGGQLKKSGYEFMGWVLNIDGGLNKNFVFAPTTNYIFNFVPIETIENDETIKKYYCYKENQSTNTQEFQLEGTNGNIVTLYAYWKANEYTIKIEDTIGDKVITSIKVSFGTDIDLSNYITQHIGYRFLGLSTSKNGTSFSYTPETTMVMKGTNITANYYFYARYELKNIDLKYKIEKADYSTVDYIPLSSSYSYGVIPYGSVVTLPTPTSGDYGDVNYLFDHWYYVDGNNGEVEVRSSEPLYYDGDELILFAKFEQQIYKMEFIFTNPLDVADVVKIDIDGNGDIYQVKKGESITTEVYNDIMTQISSLVADPNRNINSYTLKGLYSLYNNTAVQFVQGQAISSGSFPTLDITGIITFKTTWIPNEVGFVYVNDTVDPVEKVTGYHTGNNFDSSSDIILEDIKFDSFGAGESVNRWYLINIKDGTKKYFNKGDKLIGITSDFKSVKDLNDYITWENNNGTVYIYAETQQVFTVEYYRFKDGALELLSDYTSSYVYDTHDNVISLESGIIATNDYNDIIFNGWMVKDASGNYVKADTAFVIDPAVYPDYVIRLYADLSYAVKYTKPILENGVFYYETIKEETIDLLTGNDYSVVENYILLHSINTIVNMGDIEQGYEFYGYQINNILYTIDEITSGIDIAVDGNVIEVLCYIVKEITVTYQLPSGATFDDNDNTTEPQTYTYLISYDNVVVAEVVNGENVLTNIIKIKNLRAVKVGYTFLGWSIISNGEIFNTVFEPNADITILSSVNLIAVLKEPTSETVNVIIRYEDSNGNLLTDEEILLEKANGTAYTLLSGDDELINYVSQTNGIVGWSYDGIAINSNVFNIPVNVDNNQVFIFVAIVKNKYTITFETYSEDTVEDIVLFEGVETRLSILPTLDNGKDFLYWSYNLSNDASNPNLVYIAYDDAIMFKEDTEDTQAKYSSTESVKGYTLHTIPVVKGIYQYNFYAVGESMSLTLIVGVDNKDETYELKDVQYGASYTVRELVEISGFDIYEGDETGIAGWTFDKDRRLMSQYTADEQAKLIDNITNITNDDMPLYAVWQSKWVLSYASQTDTTEFGYRDEQGNTVTHDNESFFAGDIVEFNSSVIKSIYYKGYNTVYYDDGRYIVYAGTGNDYYEVSGFIIKFEDGTLYKECVFADNEYSFEAPDSNVVITPRAKSIVYRVDFDENSSDASNILYTEYVSDLSKINLNKYTPTRSNFVFVGWNTAENRNGDNKLSDLSGIANGNITLYAIWNSSLSANFIVNGVALFSVPYTRSLNINSSILTSYLRMTNSASNGYFNYNSINGNTRTYLYNADLYYLQAFNCNSKVYYTIEDLCAVTLDRSVTVNIMLNNIYKVKYTETNSVGITNEIKELEDYIVSDGVDFGRINSQGNKGDLTFATYNQSDFYHTANGWKDISGNVYLFGEIATNLSQLASLADDYDIILSLNFSAKSFQVVLNGVDNPQALYSTITKDTAKDAEWTDVTSLYLRDATGNTFASGNVFIEYGSSFVITFPETASYGYQIIGWSTNLYALGDEGNYSSDIIYSNAYYRNNGIYSSNTLILNEEILGENSVLNLYPVFKIVPAHIIEIVSEGGKFTYTIANDDNILKGFMVDNTTNVGQYVMDDTVVELTYYQVLVVEGNLPNSNYIFDGIYLEEQKIDGDTYTFLGNTNCTNCAHSLGIVYKPKIINITAELYYTHNLITGNDTSVIQIGDTTLSYAQNIKMISISADNNLDVVTSLSNYYVLDSVLDGNGAIVNLVNNKIVVSELNADDITNNVTIIFTITPKYYTVDFTLQGGVLENITYSSTYFGNGIIEVGSNTQIRVIADSLITVPTPIKEKCEFSYFTINGTRYDSIVNIAVIKNLSITAYFIQNKYTITYFYNNGGYYMTDFVGGSELTIGEGVSGYEELGINHIGWKSSNDLSDSLYTYVNGEILNTQKVNYELYEVVEGKDVTIDFVLYENGETRTLKSIVVNYSEQFNLPSKEDFSDIYVENKALYGFKTSLESQDILVCERTVAILPNGLISYTYPDSGEGRITLYCVYYNNYTYTFNYTNTMTTVIDSGKKEILAVDSEGGVLSTDLRFTLDSQIPVNTDNSAEVFIGYYVYLQVGTNEKVAITNEDGSNYMVTAGGTLELVNPSTTNYQIFSYTYTLEGVYGQSADAVELKIYITNPENEDNYLTLSNNSNIQIDANGYKYLPFYAYLTNQLYSSSLPVFDYQTLSSTANWRYSTSSNILFVTDNIDFVAHKILGYKLSRINNEGNIIGTTDILFESEEGYNLGSATNYVLTPIWQNRYFVRYYDASGNAISATDTYYDVGTKLVVDTNVSKYSKDGYKFVGYANSYDKAINTTSDFMEFGSEFEIVDENYYFHPAFAKIYTVTFNDSSSTLASAFGDASKIETIINNTLIVYIGMNEVLLTDYYQLVYGDIGYSFEGYYTLSAGKMFNELDEGEVFTNYTFSLDHLTSDGDNDDNNLTIYVAWVRAQYDVEFLLTATLNDQAGSYADNKSLKISYFHNEKIDFDNEEIVNKVNSLNNHFEFVNFSLTENGEGIDTSNFKVQSPTTIYVNYEYYFTIVYNLGSAGYINDNVPRAENAKKLLGESLVGYDADSNLLLEGRDNLYWSVLGSFDDFFEGGSHNFTASDVAYANNYYVIDLYLNSSVASYTVNLYFFDNVTMLDNHYEGISSEYSVVTASLQYGSTIFTIVADEDFETIESASSPFDIAIETYFNQVGKNNEINTLFDLLIAFENDGFAFSGNVNVNNEYEVGLNSDFNNVNYYTVQSYSGSDAYVNNLYLEYDLVYYSLDVQSLVIADENNISPLNAYSNEDILTVFEIDDETCESTNNDSEFFVTRKSEINLIYLEDIALSYDLENISYTFVGYFAATYNQDGNIVSFINVHNGNNWNNTYTVESREDGLYGGYNYIYSVLGDAKVYALYTEKPVIVNVTYNAPDNHVSEMSAKFIINSESEITSDKFTTISESGNKKVFTFKVLYGQRLSVVNSDNLYYEIDYFLIAGIKIDNQELNVNLLSDDGNLTTYAFEIVFTYKTVDIYARTIVDTLLYDYQLYAEITEFVVTTSGYDTLTLSGEFINEDYKLNLEDGSYYNYVLKVPYGSTINQINANLNNFVITGWKIGGQSFSQLTVTETQFISAVIEASSINIQFYNSDGSTKLQGFDINSIAYGSEITLPFVVVDEDSKISKSWMIGNSEYAFGEKIFAVTENNEKITDGILRILANSINKYYLIFTNGDYKFDFDSTYGTKNSLVVATENIEITGVTSYKYYIVSTGVCDDRMVTEDYVVSSYIEIPEELQFANDPSFGGWLVKSGNIFTTSYSLNKNDIDKDSNGEEVETITFTSTLSGIVSVKFYLTNPTNALDSTNDFKFSTSASSDAEYTIPYIQLFYNKDNGYFYDYPNITDSYNNVIEWSDGFFMKDTVGIMENYTFYGWSTSRRSVLSTPSVAYSDIASNSALLYKWVVTDGGYIRSVTNIQNNNDDLLMLLEREEYTFYAVWESKKTIIFDASDSTYTNGFTLTGKYSEGENIELPNNILTSSTVYYDLRNGYNKWLGWLSTDSTITYKFEDYESGHFVVSVPSQDVIFNPIWTVGASVYFDINFNDVRSYFANIMSGAIDGIGSPADILSRTGYPYTIVDLYEYNSYSTVSGFICINGSYETFTYTTQYKEGNLWTIGDIIPVYKYGEDAFSQVGIYTLYGQLDKYFDMVGWYIDKNKNGICDEGEMIEPNEDAENEEDSNIDENGRIVYRITSSDIISAQDGSIIIRALWKPVELEVEFFYDDDSAEIEDRALRYIEDNEYIVVKVPFGYKLTNYSSYAKITENLVTGSIQYLYSGLAVNMNNPINKMVSGDKRDFYRFSHWESIDYVDVNFFNNDKTDTYNANTITRAIINNVRLYPVFDTQFIVRFIGSTGTIISNDINQFVITGEEISIRPEVIKVVDERIISDVYYLNFVDTRISLWKPNPVDTLEFDENTFKITDTYYVNIYIETNITLRAYLPDYSGSIPNIIQYGEDFEIYQNHSYSLRSIYQLTDTNLNAMYGDGSNYPSFAGWFIDSYNNTNYYAIGSKAYLINESNVVTIKIISEYEDNNTNYYAVINNDLDNKIKLTIGDEGLVICLYAKLYTTTTVSLGANGNNEIIKFASLSYETDSNLDVAYYITDSYSIGGLQKSVTYVTAYNSEFSPKFSIDMRYGNRISNIENLVEDDMTEIIESTQLSNKEYNKSNFKMIISKTTTEEVDSDNTSQLKINYDLKISNIKSTNNLNFIIEIESIKYTVNYIYDTTLTTPLQYKVANRTTASWKSFATNGTITFSGEEPLYNSGVMTYGFAVSYTTTSNDANNRTTITISNIPYGTEIYVGAFAVDTLMHHFDSWEITVDNRFALSNIGAINKKEFIQKFTPVLFDQVGYGYEINLFAVMELNEVDNITYHLRFDESYFEKGSVWDKLLQSATISGLKKTTTTTGSYYTYTWVPQNTSKGIPNNYGTIKAGDSISSLISIIKEQYDSEFNRVAEVIENGEFTTIADLLNYFWFTGLWSTYESDLTNKICYLDNKNNNNIIKVSVKGKVTLFTQLDKAVLVSVLHQVKDYLDSSITITDASGNRVDRADVSVVSVSYNKNNVEVTGVQDVDYYLLGSNSAIDTNYDSIEIKLPYGYLLTIKATPESATEKHVSYSMISWSLLDGEQSGEEVVGNQANPTVSDIITLNTGIYTGSADETVTNNRFMKDIVSNIYRPELHLYADVVANPYYLNLVNCNNTIKPDGDADYKGIAIAYDSDIARIQNYGVQKYINYDYSLATLRDSNRLHLFALDEKVFENIIYNNIVLFRHTADTNAQNYGDYQYLFDYWSESSNGYDYGINTVIKSFGQWGYAPITLYSVYYTNTRIDYTLLNSDDIDNITIYSYYLPEGIFYDSFNNEYLDNLMIPSALINLGMTNSRYTYSLLSEDKDRFGIQLVDESKSGKLYIGTPNPYKNSNNIIFNNTETADEGYEHVSTVSDIINSQITSLGSSKNALRYSKIDGGYRVYPEIDVTVKLREDGKNVSNGTYVVRTLGGRYTISMLDNGKLKFNNIIGLYLKTVSDSNKIENAVIDYAGGDTKQFAYWEVWETEESKLTHKHNLAGNPYITTNNITIDNHYNVRLYVEENDNRGEGNVSVTYGTTSNSAGLIGLSLTPNGLNEEPSKVYLSETSTGLSDEDIKVQRILIQKQDYYFYVYDYTDKIIDNAHLIYKGTYSRATPTTDQFVWKLTFSKSTEIVCLYEDGDSHIVEDSDGYITISPLLFPPEITLSIATNLYIYNVNQNYMNTYGSLLYTQSQDGNATLKIDGGSKMIIDSNIKYKYKSSTVWTTKLYFQPLTELDNDDLSSFSYIMSDDSASRSSYSSRLSTLSTYTENYRWQYYYDNAWRDVDPEGNTLADANGSILQIRLACDWKTVDINFRVFDTLSGKMSSENYSTTFKYTEALISNNGTVVLDKVLTAGGTSNLANIDDYTITILANDAISYDSTNESFTITSEGRWADTTTINVTYDKKDLYSQGWFLIKWTSNKARASIPSNNYQNSNLTFAIWLEKTVDISVLVNKDNVENVVNGYGNVAINEFKVKTSSVAGESMLVGDPTSGYDGVYIENYAMGASSILRLSYADNSLYHHKHVSTTYTLPGSTEIFSPKNNPARIIAGTIGSEIKILYDASPTKSQYAITDETLNVRLQEEIYGGYTVDYIVDERTYGIYNVSLIIKDMFGNTIGDYIIYCRQNKTDYDGSFYPRYNYFVEKVYEYTKLTSEYTISNGKIVNYSLPTTYLESNGYNKIVNNYKYIHQNSNAMNNNRVLVFMDETLQTVDLYMLLQVNSIGDDGESQTTEYNYLDSNIATLNVNSSFNNSYLSSFLYSGGNLSTVKIFRNPNTKNTLLDTTELGLYYDVSNIVDRKMILSVYPNSATTNNGQLKINVDADYNFKSVSIHQYGKDTLDDDTEVISSNFFDPTTESGYVGTESRMGKLEDSRYYLVVTVEKANETNISFLSTLPYASDLANLNMTSNLLSIDSQEAFTEIGYEYYAVQNYVKDFGIAKPISFNKLNQDLGDNSNLINSSSASTGINLSPSLKTSLNTMVSVDKKGNLQFTDDNGNKIGYINYTLPSIYQLMNTETVNYGWFVLEGYTMLKSTTVTLDNGVSYKSWDVDFEYLTPVTSSGVLLKANSTLVLALKRSEVTIYMDNGSWWWSTTRDTTEYTTSFDTVANKDVNEYLKYDKFKSNLLTNTIHTAGGLVSAIPEYSSGETKDIAFTTPVSYYQASTFKSIEQNIRLGYYINISDSPVENRMASDITGGTKYNCEYRAYISNGVVPTLKPLGKNDVEYNIGLTKSTEWAFVGIPSGDSGVKGSDYTKITFYSQPADSEDNSEIGTFKFANKSMNLLQSIVSWADEDFNEYREEQNQFSIYLAKDTTTRLYSGMYHGTKERPSGNYYSRIGFSYTTSMNAPESKLGRIVLTGFTIKVNDKIIDTISYDDFDEFSYSYDLDLADLNQDSISIYPIWEEKDCYIIKFYDKYNKSGIGSSTGEAIPVLEGRSIILTANLANSVTITKLVNPSSSTTKVSTGTYDTISYTSGGKTYLFAGLTLNSEENNVYGNGSTDSNYKNYGLFRVKNTLNTKKEVTKSVLEYNTTRGNNGEYNLTITPTDNMNLYNVWWEYGYTVKYMFKGAGNVTLGYSGKTLDSKYTKADTACYYQTPICDSKGNRDLTFYGTYLVDMPYIVGYGLNYKTHISDKTSTIYKADGFSINQYFIGGGNSPVGGSIKFSSTSTIGFSLIHNTGHSSTGGGCMSTTSMTDKTCRVSGDYHQYKKYKEHNCKYCNYDGLISNTEYVNYSYKSTNTHTKISGNNTNHYKNYLCSNCGEVAKKELQAHSYSGWSTNTATCTKSGSQYRTCSLCEHKQTKTTSALGHNYKTYYMFASLKTGCVGGIRACEECTRCGKINPGDIVLTNTDHRKEAHNDLSKRCNVVGATWYTCCFGDVFPYHDKDGKTLQCPYKEETTRSPTFDSGFIEIEQIRQDYFDFHSCKKTEINIAIFPCAYKLESGKMCGCSYKAKNGSVTSINDKNIYGVVIKAYKPEYVSGSGWYLYDNDGIHGLDIMKTHESAFLSRKCKNCGEKVGYKGLTHHGLATNVAKADQFYMAGLALYAPSVEYYTYYLPGLLYGADGNQVTFQATNMPEFYWSMGLFYVGTRAYYTNDGMWVDYDDWIDENKLLSAIKVKEKYDW